MPHQAITDHLTEIHDSLLERAGEKLSKADETTLDSFNRSPVKKALVLLIEAAQLNIQLQWQSGAFYDQQNAKENPDPEAESKARHMIIAYKEILAHLEDITEWHKELSNQEESEE